MTDHSLFRLTDLPPIANFISNCLLILLLLTFLYALCIRFFPDENLYDFLNLPPGHQEKVTYFIQTNDNSRDILPKPLIFDSAEVYLTIVIPSDSNANNFQAIIDPIIAYLQEREKQNHQFTWEIIITYTTTPEDLNYQTNLYTNSIKFIYSQETKNIGSAIDAGVLFSRGQYILVFNTSFIQIQNLNEMEREMRKLQPINKESVVIGSRAYLCSNNPNIFNTFGECNSRIFSLFLTFCGVKNIKDTQCGFKLYSREAARIIFTNLHVQYLSDVEIIVIAQKTQMPISEIPVECTGNLTEQHRQFAFFTGIQTFFDLMKIAILYRIGFWTILEKDQSVQTIEL